jgi:hypothetical protein
VGAAVCHDGLLSGGLFLLRGDEYRLYGWLMPLMAFLFMGLVLSV